MGIGQVCSIFNGEVRLVRIIKIQKTKYQLRCSPRQSSGVLFLKAQATSPFPRKMYSHSIPLLDQEFIYFIQIIQSCDNCNSLMGTSNMPVKNLKLTYDDTSTLPLIIICGFIFFGCLALSIWTYNLNALATSVFLLIIGLLGGLGFVAGLFRYKQDHW